MSIFVCEFLSFANQIGQLESKIPIKNGSDVEIPIEMKTKKLTKKRKKKEKKNGRNSIVACIAKLFDIR